LRAAETTPHWDTLPAERDAPPQRTWSLAFIIVLLYAVFEYARLTDGYPWIRAFEPAKVLIGAAALAWIVFEPRAGSTPRTSLVMKALLLMVVIAIISGVFATYGLNAYNAIVGILNFTVIAFLIGKVVNTRARLQIFVFVVVLLIFKLSQHQIRYYQSIVDFGRSEEFLARGVGVGQSSFFGNSNDFGLGVATFFPLPMVLAFGGGKKWLRFLYLIAAGVIGAAIFLSGSRGSMLATAIVAAVFLLRVRRKWVGLVVLAALAVGGSFLLNEAHWERIKSATDFQQDSNAQIRLTLWAAGLEMFTHHPVLGVGPGNFAPTYGAKYSQKISGEWVPHSIYIQAMAELGIFGILALLMILVGTLRILNDVHTRAKPPTKSDTPPFEYFLANGLTYSLVAFMINGATITVLWYPHLWFLVGMSLGLASAAARLPAAEPAAALQQPLSTDPPSVF
jgi:putative inorganic carbon (hco3(-)) transporter